MTMDVFDFPYHVIGIKYPDSSAKVKYGRGYEFASRPTGPDQRILMLDFEAMWTFEYSPCDIDYEKWPQINVRVLERFYQKQRLYQKFIYPHPVEGNLVVRFNKPLEYQNRKIGNGSTEPFTLELLTQP